MKSLLWTSASLTIDPHVPVAVERLPLQGQPSENLSLFAPAGAEHAS